MLTNEQIIEISKDVAGGQPCSIPGTEAEEFYAALQLRAEAAGEWGGFIDIPSELEWF